MIKKLFCIALLSGTLIACSQIPKQAYFSRGQPEGLLDTSSEVVNLNIDSPESVQEITNWINKDQPTRAELNCAEDSALCKKTKNALHQFGVPVKYVSNSNNNIALIYERVLARDCENRYIDNTINPYNLNHPTFGCTTAANMVQMVSDKRQFISPPLMDYPDAAKTSQGIQNYMKPGTFSPSDIDSNFKPVATQESLQTNGLTGGSGGR
jgi:hypothetical protein